MFVDGGERRGPEYTKRELFNKRQKVKIIKKYI